MTLTAVAPLRISFLKKLFLDRISAPPLRLIRVTIGVLRDTVSNILYITPVSPLTLPLAIRVALQLTMVNVVK